MPRILASVGTHFDSLIPARGRDSHALSSLISILEAPPDLQGIDRVAKNALSCLQVFAFSTEATSSALMEFVQSLSKIVSGFSEQVPAPQPMAATGRKGRYPQWALLLSISDRWSETERAGVGAELARALVTEQQFPKSIASEVASRNQSFDFDTSRQKLGLRLVRQAREVLEASRGTSSRELKTNSLILASICSQLNPIKIRQRQTAGNTAELNQSELKLVANQLKSNALSGCITSLQIVISYCLGLPWDVALEVPFSSFIGGEWIAQIDVSTGVSKIDLEPCFPGLAKSQPGHLPAAPVLIRPFPEFAAELLRQVVGKNPWAVCLRGLNNTDLQSTALVPGFTTQRHTIAKFIGSRGSHAMQCGLDRANATYVSADFTKIGKAKNYYTTFSAVEIYDGCALVYGELGWGSPVSLDTGQMLGIGSRATPTEQTLRSIDQALLGNVTKHKAGKKYTQASINTHSNFFALFCAHRSALFSLGRASEAYGFYADELVAPRPFNQLPDKATWPHRGRTPIPVPICKAEQVKLWLAHLEIYGARLNKLGQSHTSPVRNRIRKILSGERVHLYFLVTDSGQIKDVGSSDISKTLPPELRIKFDLGRHFLQNKLRDIKVPQGWIDAAARHHVDGTSVSYCTANVRQIQWLEGVATAIDNISVGLNMFPVVGLGKGK